MRVCVGASDAGSAAGHACRLALLDCQIKHAIMLFVDSASFKSIDINSADDANPAGAGHAGSTAALGNKKPSFFETMFKSIMFG